VGAPRRLAPDQSVLDARVMWQREARLSSACACRAVGSACFILHKAAIGPSSPEKLQKKDPEKSVTVW
jgi:hypothetical protein